MDMKTRTIKNATVFNVDCMDIPLVKKGVKGFIKGHSFKSWLGRKHTPETKEKMRVARLKNNPMHKPDVVLKRSKTLIEKGVFARENSNRWKGGVTKEYILARNSDEYKLWRGSVFVRDGYECQHCHAKCGNGINVYLHAHHIKGFSEYPELRFDVSNGITLCKQCHYKVHSK